ncbi:MAG: metal-dependent hydrolase [Balneolaceae bacterium]|nr:metal-dependent hydrolase [Balneolaceae bacterium]
MDTITQITLGAAVGEAVLGKKMGNKGAAWGAAFGVLPDLDVLANPFVSDVQEIIIHRGLSHSLLFSAVAAPLFGWMLYRRYRNGPATWKDWSLMIFLTILTHIFIDACTGYGTQVFQPFSNYSLSFNTIFIIDPFYTLPLMAGVVTALFMRQKPPRRWANYVGLALSSLYMLAGFGIKSQVNTVFEENFEKQQISVDRYMTTPMALTEFLWVGYAQSGDTIYTGLYSIFDDDRDITFQKLDMNPELIQPYRDQLPVERILWFSHGYFLAEKSGDILKMHDLRFGRSDLWLTSEPAPLVWTYHLTFNSDSSRVTGFTHVEPEFDFSSELFGKLLDRISGK